MEIRKKQEDLKALSRIVPKVEVDDLYMISCNFNRDIDITHYESVRVNLSSSGELLSVAEDGFRSKVSLCLVANPEREENEILRIESEYILSYLIHSKKKLETNDLKTFCSINSVYNIWPYWRELVDSIANRADLPLPKMPLIKVKPSKAKTKA